MQSTYKAEEELIQKAVHAYNEQKREKKRANMTKLAQDYKVPYQRLRRRILRTDSKSTRKRTNQCLDPTQYSILYDHLDRLDDLGAPPSTPLIRNAANAILERSHTDPSTPPQVSKNWPYRFLRLTDRYMKGKLRVVAVDRKEAEDPATVMQLYNYFQLQVEIYGIYVEDIWNFDETDFRIGQAVPRLSLHSILSGIMTLQAR
jgi:hypothetical protein